MKNDQNLLILAFFLLAFFSMCTCILVAGTIYYNSELKNTHPSLLIAAMSICEFVSCWNVLIWQLNVVKVSCYFGTNKFLLYTVKAIMTMLMMDPKTYTEQIAIKDLVKCNIFFFEISQQLSLCFNACICIDLYLTFRNPFKPSRIRLRNYIIISILVVSIINPISTGLLQSNNDFFQTYLQPIVDLKN